MIARLKRWLNPCPLPVVPPQERVRVARETRLDGVR